MSAERPSRPPEGEPRVVKEVVVETPEQVLRAFLKMPATSDRQWIEAWQARITPRLAGQPPTNPRGYLQALERIEDFYIYSGSQDSCGYRVPLALVAYEIAHLSDWQHDLRALNRIVRVALRHTHYPLVRSALTAVSADPRFGQAISDIVRGSNAYLYERGIESALCLLLSHESKPELSRTIADVVRYMTKAVSRIMNVKEGYGVKSPFVQSATAAPYVIEALFKENKPALQQLAAAAQKAGDQVLVDRIAQVTGQRPAEEQPKTPSPPNRDTDSARRERQVSPEEQLKRDEKLAREIEAEVAAYVLDEAAIEGKIEMAGRKNFFVRGLRSFEQAGPGHFLDIFHAPNSPKPHYTSLYGIQLEATRRSLGILDHALRNVSKDKVEKFISERKQALEAWLFTHKDELRIFFQHQLEAIWQVDFGEHMLTADITLEKFQTARKNLQKWVINMEVDRRKLDSVGMYDWVESRLRKLQQAYEKKAVVLEQRERTEQFDEREKEYLQSLVGLQATYLRDLYAARLGRDLPELEGFGMERDTGELASVQVGGGYSLSQRLETRFELRLAPEEGIFVEMGDDRESVRRRLGMVDWVVPHEVGHLVVWDDEESDGDKSESTAAASADMEQVLVGLPEDGELHDRVRGHVAESRIDGMGYAMATHFGVSDPRRASRAERSAACVQAFLVTMDEMRRYLLSHREEAGIGYVAMMARQMGVAEAVMDDLVAGAPLRAALTQSSREHQATMRALWSSAWPASALLEEPRFSRLQAIYRQAFLSGIAAITPHNDESPQTRGSAGE